ncbi:MAG: flagellar hook-associated protein FlgK [Pirellulaceae bacterium]|nr:flagellar hook-associated protein FlgK [Pirellulaceae bacterium]
MSLFSALQVSSNALRVNQLGLQVVSNNIANANTPGYIRQELIQDAGPGYKLGSSIVGLGVRSVGVQQRVDEFLLQSIREVQSKISRSEGLQEANSKLETALSELGDNDLSTSMSKFSNAMQDLANTPGNTAVRSLAIQRGRELSEGIQQLSGRITGIALNSNTEIKNTANQINVLTDSIAKLNQRVVELEGGSSSTSDAVGIRDQRIKALDELSKLVDIHVTEQETGAVTVIVGGDYLVADGLSRQVNAVSAGDAKVGSAEIRIVDTDAALVVTSGRLKGLYDVRDGSTATFSNRLDDFARNIIRQVNQIHSQGQGATGLSEVVGEPVLIDNALPIEQSGSNIDINNGSFEIQVLDASTNQTRSFDIFIKQQGQTNDTTVNDLVSQLSQISGIQASTTADGRFQIRTASSAIKFSFANDTSGVLSALGLNTFFSGNSASTIQVRSDIVNDPSRLAISLDGPGKGNRNAVALAEVFDRADASLGGQSLRESYESMITVTTQDINSQQSITDGLQNFLQTLEAKHLGVSGVSLDEEGIKMLLYQRAFQASSRVISVTNELLDTLVKII